MESVIHFLHHSNMKVESSIHFVAVDRCRRYAGPMAVPSPASGRPLRRDAERNRQALLAAARRLIAVSGLDVGYDAIAREAGIGVATVYRRFPTREQLYEELYRDRIDAVVAIAEAALAVDDPWAGLSQFVERDFELQIADRGLREYQLGRATSGEVSRVGRERIKPLVERLIARAKASGHLRADVGDGDIAIMMAMLGTMMDATLAVSPDLWRRYLAMALDGLRLGPDRDPLPGRAPDRSTMEAVLMRWVLGSRGPRS